MGAKGRGGQRQGGGKWERVLGGGNRGGGNRRGEKTGSGEDGGARAERRFSGAWPAVESGQEQSGAGAALPRHILTW